MTNLFSTPGQVVTEGARLHTPQTLAFTSQGAPALAAPPPPPPPPAGGGALTPAQAVAAWKALMGVVAQGDDSKITGALIKSIAAQAAKA